MPDWMQIILFYDGLRMSNKAMIDAAAGGALATKTIPEAKELIEKMAYNSSHTTSERGVLKKPDMDNSQVKSLFDQTRDMKQKIASLTKQLSQMQVVANVLSQQHLHPLLFLHLSVISAKAITAMMIVLMIFPHHLKSKLIMLEEGSETLIPMPITMGIGIIRISRGQVQLSNHHKKRNLHHGRWH